MGRKEKGRIEARWVPGCQNHGKVLDELDVSWQTCRKLFAAAFQAVKSQTHKKTKKKKEKTSQIKKKETHVEIKKRKEKRVFNCNSIHQHKPSNPPNKAALIVTGLAKSVKACLTVNRSVMGTLGFSLKTPPLIGRFPRPWGRNLDTTLAQPSLARNPARF